MNKASRGRLRGSKTWNAWRSMKERCNNPKSLSYKNYGARGITYDPAWESFDTFVKDMGVCPERVNELTLDRKDNNGNYNKDNCRWASRSEQTLNQRKRTDNTSGIAGVFRENCQSIQWVANSYLQGVRTVLYRGPDFFEACCVRKSWEAAHKGASK